MGSSFGSSSSALGLCLPFGLDLKTDLIDVGKKSKKILYKKVKKFCFVVIFFYLNNNKKWLMWYCDVKNKNIESWLWKE